MGVGESWLCSHLLRDLGQYLPTPEPGLLTLTFRGWVGRPSCTPQEPGWGGNLRCKTEATFPSPSERGPSVLTPCSDLVDGDGGLGVGPPGRPWWAPGGFWGRWGATVRLRGGWCGLR